MNLYNAISKRKATRQYLDTPLDSKVLDGMIEKLKSFELLYLDSPLEFRVVNHTKGFFNVEAPHYLIISGKGSIHEKENAGFVGQRFVLWLHTIGIGSVWLGASKDKGKARSKNDIIVIAFGNAKVSIERELSEFKRKKIETITNIPEDDCIKAVHLAPSGMNQQPWYFEKRENKVIVYEQKLKAPLNLVYKSTLVDIGIALCHYKIVCEQLKKPFVFQFLSAKTDKKGFKLIGEISLN